MYTYLRPHPDIFLPPVWSKEPFYFGSDLTLRAGRISTEDYLALFQDATDEKCVGEGSTGYLYSSNAAGEIYSFCPEARIVMILRNPVDMVYSLHSHLLYSGEEDISDFEQALAAEADRREGRRLPPRARSVDRLLYRRVARYHEQVKRYFDTFGRDQVHVIIHDDMQRDIATTYRSVLWFLEVDEQFQPEFTTVNANKEARTRWGTYLYSQYPPTVRRIGRILLPSQRLQRAVVSTLRRLNTRYVKRPPMKPETRRRLCREFAADVERLSQLLGRDLTHWTRE